MVYFLGFFVFILGAAWGSFLNCLAWRLYHEESLMGRSACPKCHQKIHWYDNIPLVSWLALRGQCRQCREKIAMQYWLVELATAGLFVLAFYMQSRGLNIDWFNFQLSTFNLPTWGTQAGFINLLRDWFVICVLMLIFLMDLKWYVVLDEISLPAIVIVFLANWALGASWSNLILSAIIGAGFFAMQYVISRGRWVGSGDIRLGALLGVLLGYPGILVGLMLAYFSGALVGVGLILGKKKGLKSAVPFGAFLAPAALVAWWWGGMIWSWYINLLS